MTIRSYADLEVWQRAMDLIEALYGLTKRFPTDERFALTSQLQRATVSIAANIAEGHARQHTREYLHHLSIARGSLAEAQTLVQVAVRVGHCTSPQVAGILQEADTVGRMLNKLCQALRQRLERPGPSPLTPDP